MHIVVLGITGRTPVAGVAWQALHYLQALRNLGNRVYYVEDTKAWPYNPETATSDCLYTVKYLDRLMSWCGMRDHWAFCDVSQGGRVYGCSELRLSTVFKEADIIINLTGSSRLSDDHLRVPVRVYLETDPGVPQILLAQGNRCKTELLAAHTHHFTFAENYGQPDCLLPVGNFPYRPTRQPVVMDWWHPDEQPCAGRRSHASAFTTVASWKQSNDVVWKGETYTWSKDKQFMKFLDLPARSGQSIELALACADPQSITLLESHGWRVSDALTLTSDFLPYRDFILSSRGEFTVAKDQNVRLHTGWFSDRSACYLAAGRPVVTQDTGFGAVLPTGEGLFAFNTMEDILAALENIHCDYDRHSRAARELASQYFKAETVMTALLDSIGA